MFNTEGIMQNMRAMCEPTGGVVKTMLARLDEIGCADTRQSLQYFADDRVDLLRQARVHLSLILTDSARVPEEELAVGAIVFWLSNGGEV